MNSVSLPFRPSILLKKLTAFSCFLMLIGLTSGSVWPQAANPQTLTLDQALSLAVANNPQVKAAQARLDVSQAEIITAGARLNPSLLSDNGIAEKTYRLGIEQTIRLGGKRRKQVALAEAQRDVVLAEINTAILDIRTNVRRAYTQLYNLQERQRSYQELLQTSHRLVDIAQKREKAGDIPPIDTLQAEIIALNTQNDFQSLSYQITQARNSLNTLLNQPLGSSVELAPPETFPTTFPGHIQTEPNEPQSLQGNVSQLDIDPDRLIQEAFKNRPELQQNLRSAEAAQRQLALAKANRIPNVTLAAGPDRVTGEGGSTSAFFIGNVELPILNRQQGPIREALARLSLLEQERNALKNRITLEVTNAYTAFVQSRQRVNLYEAEILPKSQEVVQKSQRSFEVGKSTILIPINAQQAYINTQIGYLQALADYQNAISDLERAVGTGL